MKILIPVDGSEYSQRAVTHFFNFRAFFDLQSHFTLIHVLPPVGKLTRASMRADLLAERKVAEVEKAMAWTRNRFSQSRVAFDEQLSFGDPAHEISEYAAKHEIDLILMGSRGHGTVRGMIVGSTTMKVLAACKIPVLVVR